MSWGADSPAGTALTGIDGDGQGGRFGGGDRTPLGAAGDFLRSDGVFSAFSLIFWPAV